jgi:hypothetical protein
MDGFLGPDQVYLDLPWAEASALWVREMHKAGSREEHAARPQSRRQPSPRGLARLGQHVSWD